MKINLEVIHSCTIKRKKPWPRITWIGKDKEKLFLLDNQRISLIDPKNGKTKRKVAKISSQIKSIVSSNVSDDGVYFIAILSTGDLILWNKDSETLRNITGRNEFALRLGFHCPNVFISNDAKKIILITSRNKVFVWETERLGDKHSNKLEGNWSDIVASKDIKTVEDNKELVLDTQFVQNQYDGVSATCCFVFNYENKQIINVLKIRWLSPSEITSANQCRFVTLWICYQPVELDPTKPKLNCLYTRGAYAIKLSHSADLLALASNQKYIHDTSLVFMSVSNGTLHPINLRNFGLNSEAKGRHYWIQELQWMFNDLYLICITKHGAIFLISRLGQPLLIHALGKEINMGPALFISIHPLIIVRNKSDISLNGDASLNSAIENEDNLRQRYSITSHPSLPIFLCSDGYLLCILKLESAYSNQSRLMRELMQETISLLNSSSLEITNKNYELKNPLDKLTNTIEEDKYPDWGLQTVQASIQSEKSSDSGVEELKEKRTNSFGTKIAEGKIIFSYLPQVMPISQETLQNSSLVSKLEISCEYLQTSWNLLVSTTSLDAIKNTHEFDQTAKAIQQSFAHFCYLFLVIDSSNLKKFQIFISEYKSGTSVNEFKIQVLVDLFVRMLKFLNFDPAAKFNPNSHMIIYIPLFLEKFIHSLIKYNNLISIYDSDVKLFSLIYSLLNASETILKSIYSFKLSKNFSINTDTILAQRTNNQDLDIVSGDETTNMQTKADYFDSISFNDLIFEKSWNDLLSLVHNSLTKPSKELNMLAILIEQRLQKLPSIFNNQSQMKLTSIKSRKQIFNVNRADMIYLAYGDLDQAIDEWISQLNEIFSKLNSKRLKIFKNDLNKSIKICHKIFYSCLENYRLKKLISFINSYFQSDNEYSPFNLMKNSFNLIKVGKPLQKTHIAIVSLIKSLARFMALYFINTKKLFINTISNPVIMPSLLDESSDSSLKIEMSKLKLTNCINNSHYEPYVASKNFIDYTQLDLVSFFTADKALELLIVTGLYDEAIYFLCLINDWKNSYLIGSILKENEILLTQLEQLPFEYQPDNLLASKLKSLLGIDKDIKLLDKQQLNSISLILKELLLCSVMTRTNIIEPLLTILMESLVYYTKEICNNMFIITEDEYLKLPPIYCIQIDDNSLESNLRFKLYYLIKCVSLILISSNLHCPLIKWYLDKLVNSAHEMKTKYGIINTFQISFPLKNLLTLIRYQKISYIPENILNIFRDYCSVVYLLELRDKFSLALRQYAVYLIQNQHENESNSKQLLSISLKIIDYGCLILSYKSFLNQNQRIEIQDIVLSTISRLTSSNFKFKDLNLEFKLANLVLKTKESTDENFNLKLIKLIEVWKQIPTESQISMADIYEHNLEVTLSTSTSKLNAIYGKGEQYLLDIYEKKQVRSSTSLTGAYDFERSIYSSEFLELFFKIGFDQTEDWESLVQAVNQTPLLPEFYEVIRNKQIPLIDIVDKEYIMTNVSAQDDLKINRNRSLRRRRTIIASESFEKEFRQCGLFRSYSIVNLNLLNQNNTDLEEKGMKKSVSFSNLNESSLSESESKIGIINQHEDLIRTEKPLKVLDYGLKYAQVVNLSIWLMKWSIKFQKLLVNNKLTEWQQETDKKIVTLKLNSINANFLSACFYLADNNNLDFASKMIVKKQRIKQVEDDDLTQISTSFTTKKSNNNELNKSLDESSTSIDISSLTDNQIKNVLNMTNNIDPIKEKQQLQQQPQIQERYVSPQRIRSRSASPKKSLQNQSILSFKLKDEDLIQTGEFTLTQEMTSFYNLKEDSKVAIKPPFNTQISQQSTSSNKDDLLAKSLDKTLESITQITRRNSSPSPSKSPVKESTSNLNLLQFNKQQTLMNTIEFKPTITPTLVSQPTNIQDMIRSELKKVIQMQHDTVMNFLNGNSLEPSYRPPILPNTNFQNVDNQLSSILNQQQFKKEINGEPVEFIIETKVKTVDSLTGQLKSVSSIFNNVDTSKPKQPDYFMKTFDTEKPVKQIKSNLINIPLLSCNEVDLDTSRTPRSIHLPLIETNRKQQPNEASGLKLLGFNDSPKHVIETPRLDQIEKKGSSVNKHIKNLIEATSKTSKKSLKDFQLLKLNYREEPLQVEPIKESVEPKLETIVPIKEKIKPVERKKSEIKTIKLDEPTKETKETQVDKPNYDGYVLQPEIFKENLNEMNYESVASIHYKATQHLREPKSKENKKDSYTMTETLKNADPIAPGILFKMKFDSKRKDRELAESELESNKDFVNVVDLDGQAVNEILKMIEIEQSRRGSKVISPRKEKKKLTREISKESIKQDKNSKEEEPVKHVDFLTEKLLNESEANKNEWKEYDDVIGHQLDEVSREANLISGKQKILNDLKSMDEKIKIMNKLADNMSSDYKSYNKILSTVQDMNKKSELISQEYDEEERNEKQKKLKAEKEEKVKFYQRKEADDRITNLKKSLNKSKKPETKKQKPIVQALDNLSDLSDLKEDEEKRLKEILNTQKLNSTNELLQTGNSSVTNLLKNVFNSLDIESVDDLNSEKLDKLIEHSTSPTKLEKQKKLIHEPPVKLKARKTSPVVKKEKKLSEKRDLLHEKFTSKREEDAKALLEDILIENQQFSEETNRILNSARSGRTKSPIGSIRLKESKAKIVPELKLDTSSIDLKPETKKKPSLMAKTIMQLEKKESARKNETEHLLKELEYRAKIVTKPIIDKSRPPKTIKPFTSYVQLQDPNKLRSRPDHKSLTYGQQLKLHQENTVKPKTSLDQVYKIYGTKRIPGLYKGYTKQTPRKPKTYTQILQELKPAESQAKISRKHELKLKSNKKINQNTTINRFNPYKSSKEYNDDENDDLSSWSIDDKVKSIIYNDYDERIMKRVSYHKDIDQDTLADTDSDFINDLLYEENAKNRNKNDIILNSQEEDDYLDQVNLDDLKNISFSSESALSSYIDWDQIEQICGTKF